MFFNKHTKLLLLCLLETKRLNTLVDTSIDKIDRSILLQRLILAPKIVDYLSKHASIEC